MKKRLLSIILCFTAAAGSAQTFKNDEAIAGKIIIDTVSESTYNKKQLYSNAMAYINTSFKDSRNQIISNDAESGEITFSGATSQYILRYKDAKKTKRYGQEAMLFYKCRLYLKDNKFKIILGDLEYPLSPNHTNLLFPVKPGTSTADDLNDTARVLAIDLIKNIATAFNRKPENEF